MKSFAFSKKKTVVFGNHRQVRKKLAAEFGRLLQDEESSGAWLHPATTN